MGGGVQGLPRELQEEASSDFMAAPIPFLFLHPLFPLNYLI